MIVRIKEIQDAGAEGLPFSFTKDASALELQTSDYSFEGIVNVKGTLTFTGNVYRIEGEIRATKHFVCDRCLDEFHQDRAEHFFDELTFAGEEGEDLLVDEGTLDIERYVRDTLLSAQPIQSLCKDDCLGLCSRCGQNLNQGECGCDRTSIDPRLADLVEYFRD